MNINKEFEELQELLKQQRDEIELQLHLASMEAKDEWHKADKKWAEFLDSLGVITDETKETSNEIIHATKVIGDELKHLYQGISDQLKK